MEIALDIRDKPWQPKRFNSRHKVVCVLKANGFTNAEIAEHTGYTESRVSIILNDPRAVGVIADAEGIYASNMSDVGERIKALAKTALDVTSDIMDDLDEKGSTRLTAALGILDRAGYSKVNKSIELTAPLSPEMAKILMDTERESIPLADYSIDDAD